MANRELQSRIEVVEKRLDEHIHDGIDVWKGLEGVQNDVKWIKRSLWALVSLGISFNALMIKFVLSRLIP